jgi:hypothetical protein
MFDPLCKADRYRAVAAEFADRARAASSDFPRSYYQRIAERYQSLAEGGADLQPDEATLPQSPAAYSTRGATEPKLADANDRGFVHAVRKMARRVRLLPYRRAN